MCVFKAWATDLWSLGVNVGTKLLTPWDLVVLDIQVGRNRTGAILGSQAGRCSTEPPMKGKKQGSWVSTD